MLGAGLLVPSLAASADESHSDDHRPVICHHVEGHGGTYLRSIVDVPGIHGHATHDDVIGDEGETDPVCAGPTVSELPEEGEHGEESSHTSTPKPSHTSTSKPSHTATQKPSHSHGESCSDSATPTETPVETNTATPVIPGTDVPSTTDPVQPDLARTGSNPLLPLVAGILLVLVGIAAMVLAARRAPTPDRPERRGAAPPSGCGSSRLWRRPRRGSPQEATGRMLRGSTVSPVSIRATVARTGAASPTAPVAQLLQKAATAEGTAGSA